MKPLRPAAIASGFTLTELLIGSVLAAGAVGLAATLIVGHIRSTDRMIWDSQTRRDIGRLSFLMATELGESCTLLRGAAPTNCVPPSTSPCPGTSTAADLRALVPVQTSPTSAPVNEVVRYYLSGTQLLRDGPRILSNGRLDTSADQTGALLLENVTAFTPVVSSDCRSVTVTLTLGVPNSGTSRTETLTLRTGAGEFLS